MPEPMPPMHHDGKVIVPSPVETTNYTVHHDMSIMELAMDHGFAWQHVLVLNPEISNPMLKLKAGQVIKLPVH